MRRLRRSRSLDAFPAVCAFACFMRRWTVMPKWIHDRRQEHRSPDVELPAFLRDAPPQRGARGSESRSPEHSTQGPSPSKFRLVSVSWSAGLLSRGRRGPDPADSLLLCRFYLVVGGAPTPPTLCCRLVLSRGRRGPNPADSLLPSRF